MECGNSENINHKYTIIKIVVLIAVTLISIAVLVCIYIFSTTCKVTFEIQQGVTQESIRVKKGTSVETFEIPQRSGYTFIAWEYNNKELTNTSTINHNVILKAKWLENSKLNEICVVKFDANGGSYVEDQKIYKGEVLELPNSPTKDGYEFICWELNGKQFDVSESITEDITLQAKWNKKILIVTFDVAGGSNVASQKVEYGNRLITPEEPNRTGYYFLGWKLGDDYYNFEKQVTEDIVLQADWGVKKYKVMFETHGGGYIAPQTVSYGQNATYPEMPQKSGYIFRAWLLNGKEFSFVQPITDNVILEASYDKI